MATLPAPINPRYQDTTLGAFLTMLSERLGDPSNVFWSRGELRLYVAEALHTWQSYTGWYRTSATLQSKAGIAWYDLSQSLIENSLASTATDLDIVTACVYHLLERQLVNGRWAGTDQFDLSAIQAALTNRINRFLDETGVVINRVVQQSGSSAPVSRVLITGSASQVRRLAWIDADGVVTLLWLANEWEINAFLAAQPSSDTPLVYSMSTAPPTSVRLAPRPTAPGQLELLIIPSVPTFGLNGSVLGIPDDLAWGIKFGVLADLLSADGQAKDLTRAAYCESRFNEAIQLGRVMPSVLEMSLLSGRVWIGTVFELDAFKAGWENLPSGLPVDFAMAGRGLAVLSPTPASDANYTLDIAAPAPIPSGDTDYLQISPPTLPLILDYAQHLASFKMGGDEFLATQPLLSNFVKAAVQFNTRLRQLDFFNDATRTTALKEQAERPQLPLASLVSYSNG